MFKLIGYESCLFLKSKKNQLLFFVLLLYIAGFVCFILYKDITYKDVMIKAVIEQKTIAGNQVTSLKQNLEDRKRLHTNDKIDQQEIDFWDKERMYCTQLEYYYKGIDDDSKSYLQLQIDRSNNLLNGLKKAYMDEGLLKATGYSHFELKRIIKLNTYMLKNNIKPLENTYQLNGINFLILFLNGYNPLLILIILSFFMLDIFLSEVEEGSYKLHYTLPYSRRKLFFGKIVGNLIPVFSLFFSLMIGFFIGISCLKGIGSLDYPITLAGGKSFVSLLDFNNYLGNIKIVHTTPYLAAGYLLLIAIIFFVFGMIITLSVITNSLSATLGIIMSLLIINLILGFFLKETSLLFTIKPLSYINIYAVLNAQIRAPFLLGFLLNIIVGILLILVSCIIFQKKDITGGNA